MYVHIYTCVQTTHNIHKSKHSATNKQTRTGVEGDVVLVEEEEEGRVRLDGPREGRGAVHEEVQPGLAVLVVVLVWR